VSECTRARPSVREGDWYGTTVNVAARLCAATGGGRVLVSEATCEAAERLRHIQLDEPELHWLKNLTEPVPARLASERRRCPASGRWSFRLLKAAIPARLQGATS
jgi:class 3 adenylate cyclase